MADIAFLLIIFFMVTINFEVDKTQVYLPKTEIRLEIPKKAAYISITENGQIRVSSGEEISVPVTGAEDVLSFAAIAALEDDGDIYSCDISPNGKQRKIYTLREPLNIIAAITPFNHPLNTVIHKLAPAVRERFHCAASHQRSPAACWWRSRCRGRTC